MDDNFNTDKTKEMNGNGKLNPQITTYKQQQTHHNNQLRTNT